MTTDRTGKTVKCSTLNVIKEEWNERNEIYFLKIGQGLKGFVLV